ncbi:MAG: hypothetical protein ABEJ57_06990 [Halobacteriaceae archaeon]
MRAVAINVGANTTAPGVRGPIYPDGSIEFVPIPEPEPTTDPPPTYADLDLDTAVPDPTDPVHLDPTFAEYAHCSTYTYGDPWGVKARPLLDLAAGDHVYFYATLTPRGEDHPDWVTPDWGAYLIGRFTLDRDPITGEEYEALSAPDRAPYAENAHLRRDRFDAAVLLSGDPAASTLFETAIPLSTGRGTDPNHLVTQLSTDSGAGPWWRRPLRFDADAAATLADIVERGPPVT